MKGNSHSLNHIWHKIGLNHLRKNNGQALLENIVLMLTVGPFLFLILKTGLVSLAVSAKDNILEEYILCLNSHLNPPQCQEAALENLKKAGFQNIQLNFINNPKTTTIQFHGVLFENKIINNEREFESAILRY